ncbi:MAG: Phosphatidate cytidylyltransferase [Candidatus Tokpelaia hoelldobleri]|uniref:Phosphatidate cytidylyltransferase n=1 Tax=Candidatus Tokpelaia hoelldobleri TaxID=1902579 RepID=A0A1U9JUC9_9HYPH|nr:MAG: Phosphatidate cytidylyltransferase [Candidatus Tokpelaia hoelldoblerii]
MSNFLVRVLTSVPLVILTLAAVWLGSYWFMAFCAIIGALVLYEWGAITAIKQSRLTGIASFVCYAATVAALFICLPKAQEEMLSSISMIWLGVLVAVVLLAVLSGRNAGWVAGGYLYAAIFMISMSTIRIHADLWLTYAFFIIVWATDIGAYFCGRLIGGPKLAPRISPKKTWSGAIGGVFIAVLCYWIFLLLDAGKSYDLKAAILFSLARAVNLLPFVLLLSVISQLGDLGESWLKRHFDAKDSGNILPGHGGVMDRVDGLVAASAAVYIYGIFIAVREIVRFG